MSDQTPRPDALHYRLTHAEWLDICQKLKPAEMKLLYYLRTLDPFGDRNLELGVREIAAQINCDPGTISRALRKLADQKLIDLELLRVRVRVRSLLRTDNTVAYRQHSRPSDNTCCVQTTPVAVRQHPLRTDNTCSPKPRHSNSSKSPHTLHTDQTDQTLSPPPTTLERELIDFVIRQMQHTEGIKNPRAYALRTLERDRAHWEEAFSQWQQRSIQTTIPPPSPEQKTFDERESLIGLLQLKHQQGQPISLALKQRAIQLGIDLGATTP
jgi:hypothetical protein